MSAQVTITQLPTAGPITGTESVPIVQNGQTVQTTTGAIAAAPSQTQTFLTVNNEATLPNSRYLSTGTGLSLTDGGAQSFYRITMNGAAGSLESALTGIVAKDTASSVVGRTLQTSGSGLSVTDGNGVAGNPTFSLTGQVLALANASSPGIVVLPANGSVLSRTIQGTASEIDVAFGSGVSGNPTIGLADNPVVPGVEGVVVPTGNTAARPVSPTNGTLRYNSQTQTFEGYANNAWGALAVGAGVASVDASGGTTGMTFSGGPITSSGILTLGGTLGVANGGTGATTLTGYVKGNGASAFTAASTIPNTDVTGLGSMSTQSASSVAITGGTASGLGVTSSTVDNTIIGGTTPAAGTFTSVTMTTGSITTAPVSGNDIVNKTYADSIASGINFHQACAYATTAALPSVNYSNGTGGVGATLTATANGALTIDGYTFVSPGDIGKRVLIKNQANQAQNGVYTVTQAGDGSNPFILTRATDFDSAGSGVDQIDAGDFFLITAGTANANTSWVQQTPLPITIGTTAIVFSQFGAPLTYSAGTGLSESPAYTFNIANTGVASGAYGGATSVPAISINAQGQITSATNTSIAIDASQVTSGSFGVSRGGTGITGYAVGDLIFANTTSSLDRLTVGTNGYVLVSNGTAPGYVAQSTLSVGSATTATTATSATSATTATNVAGGSAGALPYNSATNATTFLNLGTSGQVLTAGASAPQYVDQSTLAVGSATTASNLAGGGAGQIPYNSASGTTGFVAAGSAGQVLQSNGTSAPTWVTPSTGISTGKAIAMAIVFGG